MTEQQGEQQGAQQGAQPKLPGGGELSNFERLSAVIPKKTPMAIIIGTALIPLILWIINLLAPTEAVEELKEAEKETTAATQAGGPDIDEL